MVSISSGYVEGRFNEHIIDLSMRPIAPHNFENNRYSASSIIRTSIIHTLMYPNTTTGPLPGKGHIVHEQGIGRGCHTNLSSN